MTKEHGQSDYALDNAGRLTGLTRYSNLAETTEVAATVYSYDHANRMTGIVDSNSTGTTLVTYGYTYDYGYAYCSPCRECYRSPASAKRLKRRTDFLPLTQATGSDQTLFSCSPVAVECLAA